GGPVVLPPAIRAVLARWPPPCVRVYTPPPLALLARRYSPPSRQAPPLLHELLLWNAGSMALTFVISYLWIRRTLRAPEPDGLDR
ncbi:hypothetical protein EIJ76_23375, partial [Xanthomonas perforans]